MVDMSRPNGHHGFAVGDPQPVTFTATAVLPYDNPERALHSGASSSRPALADRRSETFVATGPKTTAKDARGNTWFEWVGTVDT